MESYAYIAANLAAVRADLAAIAAEAGRPCPSVVAVTKSACDAEVLALAACGVDAMAENRVPNYRARRDLLASAGFSPALHLIGSLQTNKVKYIAADVAMIQSLDSLRLAEEIERQAAKVGRTVPVLCEVNSGREAAKGGLMPEDVLPFLRQCADGRFPHLTLAGLMTMGPALPEEEIAPCFRATRSIFDLARDEGLFSVPSPVLSMGMSDSYRTAAREGATMVRVGRRLFDKSASSL